MRQRTEEQSHRGRAGTIPELVEGSRSVASRRLTQPSWEELKGEKEISVFHTPPTTGDPQRDALLVEIFALHDRLRALSMELLGPVDLPTDLTMQQLRVLGAVAYEPGLTGQELGARLGVSAPTASGLIDRLVEKGVLERTDDATDRRVRRLHLTEEGRRVLTGLDDSMGRLFETVVPPISVDDLRTIMAGSEVMLRAVETALAHRAD